MNLLTGVLMFMLRCIVCGASQEEVVKLFCFPRQKERLKKWQLAMGMVHKPNISGHIRICARHFTEDCFMPFTNPLRLRSDAVPTISAMDLMTHQEPQASTSHQTSSLDEEVLVHSRYNSPETHQEPQASISHQTSSLDEEALVHSIRDNSPENMSTPINQTPENKIRIRKSLFKDIDNLCSANVTPRKKALIGIVKRKQSQLRKLQKKCKSRGMTINSLQNIDTSLEMHNIAKNMSPAAFQLMIGQIRCSKRSPQGRRWTLDQKIIALALYKRSPKCYALLRRLLTLPSKYTLNKLLQKVPFEVGINNHIFTHLSECLQSYEENERLCCLLFDEMAIREHVQYNSLTDCIEGVEDLGKGNRTENLAKYALVFLVQGITKAWKQPVAYYFTRNGITSIKLKSILEDILNVMTEAGIPVVATVCDMGTANVKMIKGMGCSITKPYFTFKSRTIFSIFDVPHLLKCIRSLFQKYNVLIPTIMMEECEQTMEARWADIKKAYEEDKKNPLIFRSLHKLKDTYLAPLRQTAMKVKIAAQTLSRSVSVYLFNLVKQELLPSRAIATATFVNEVDQMFDSLNSSSKCPPDGKPFRCAVTDDSGHTAFWVECQRKVSKWKFIRKPSDITNPIPWKPPSQQGWMHTLEGFKELWCYLKTLGVKYLNPRRLNQDALENLFGAIRAGCGCNENPTVTQFVSSLKTQIINGLANQTLTNANCEEDELSLLSNLRTFITAAENEDSQDKPLSDHYIPTTDRNKLIDPEEIRNMVAEGHVESLSVAYVSGFIVKRLFKHITCENCTKDLCSDDLEPFNQFIALKEFSDTNSKLFYPSERLTVAVGCGITILENEILRKEMNIHKTIMNILLEKLDFTFLSCSGHSDVVKKDIISGITSIGVPWYCTRLVRDIKAQAREYMQDKKLRKLQHT